MDALQFKVNNSWVNAYTQYGVMMGDNFIDSLLPPIPLKPFVTNRSRLIDGERTVIANVRKDSRTLTLNFAISGNSPADFKAKKAAFYGLLYSGELYLRFDPNAPYRPTTESFHLIYNGESVSYAEDLTHTGCKISVKFKEPNPTDR